MSIAVVTGASGGIGAEIAKRLAQDGFSVALIYNRNAEKAQKTADEITLSGGSAKTYKCDVRDSSEITSAIEAIERDFGEISVLVNNAGISEQKLLTDITDSDWENMISTNLSGAFYFCRAVLPYFIHRKSGRIINISSMWGETGGFVRGALFRGKSRPYRSYQSTCKRSCSVRNYCKCSIPRRYKHRNGDKAR